MNRVVREILVDLGDDFFLKRRTERVTQCRKGSRRRNDDKGANLVLAVAESSSDD